MCWADGKDFDLSKVETKNEILDLKWLKVAKVYYKWELFNRTLYMDIYKKSIYNCYGTWAFKTHKDKIIEMLKTTVKNGKVFELDE